MKLKIRLRSLLVAAAATTVAVGAALMPATAGAAEPGPAGPPWSRPFHAGTHNMHYAQATFNDFADVIGWQEVERGSGPVTDPLGKLREELGPDYTTFAFGGAANAVPISWRTSMFSLVDDDASCTRTHPGEAHVTPHRYFCSARLRHLDSGREFVFVNTHFISGIYNHPERVDRWNLHMELLRAFVQSQLDAGRQVVVIGDFNNQRRDGEVPGLMNLPGVHSLMDEYAELPRDQMYASDDVFATNAAELPYWGSDHYAYKSTIKLPLS